MNESQLDDTPPEHPSFVDLTGRVFGLLTVDRYAGRTESSYYWHCRCQCGSERMIDGRSLRSGRTRTCGSRSKHPTRLREKMRAG